MIFLVIVILVLIFFSISVVLVILQHIYYIVCPIVLSVIVPAELGFVFSPWVVAYWIVWSVGSSEIL